MDNIRFTSLYTNTASNSNYGASFMVGGDTSTEPTNPTAQVGVDEFVFNGSNNTLTGIQEPLCYIDAMRSNSSCSWIL